MSAGSNYLENEVLDHFLGVGAFTFVATQHVGFTTPSPRTTTFTNATNLVNDTAHPYSNGDPVTFNPATGTDSLPTGLTAQTKYYVVNANVNDYQVSLTVGGSAVTFSDDGSGTLYSYALLKEDMTNLATLEASTGGYVRKAISFNAASSGTSTNNGIISWTASGARFGDIIEFIVTESLAGNAIFYGLLDVKRVIEDTETFEIASTALSISAD